MDSEQYPWPEDDKEYKVIQFRLRDKPYLRFTEAENNFHSEIVQDFSQDYGIGISGHENPIFLGDEAEITGAGGFHIVAGDYHFFGKSTGYDKKIDLVHLKEVQSNNPDKEIYFDSTLVREL